MYLLFVVQEEGTQVQKFSTLKEAKSSFKEETNKENSEYNVAVALYDFDKNENFGISDYGFRGETVKEWHNEEW
jgi:hypothetical protein